jgi:hypothetical protein
MTGKSKSTSNGDDAPKEDAIAPMGSVYSSLVKPLVSALYIVGFLNVLFKACVEAYNIRLYAINEYGRVIHEFDPYFNYRAAEVSFFLEKLRWSQEDQFLQIFHNLTLT